MENKKQNIDQPAVDARKKNPIIRPDKNCKSCGGKGVGDPVRRAMVACPKCKAEKPASTPPSTKIPDKIIPDKKIDKKTEKKSSGNDADSGNLSSSKSNKDSEGK